MTSHPVSVTPTRVISECCQQFSLAAFTSALQMAWNAIHNIPLLFDVLTGMIMFNCLCLCTTVVGAQVIECLIKVMTCDLVPQKVQIWHIAC